MTRVGDQFWNICRFVNEAYRSLTRSEGQLHMTVIIRMLPTVIREQPRRRCIYTYSNALIWLWVKLLYNAVGYGEGGRVKS
jgi:hypothetical protein